MTRYRKKPVVVEAMRWDGTRESIQAICDWANDDDLPVAIVEYQFVDPDSPFDVTVATLEGYLTASPGDYVIKGIKGEFYPCKPDIFEATYEAVSS